MTPKRSSHSGPGTMWIGGRALTTLTIDEPEAFRAEAVLWLDATNDKILAGDIVKPPAPASVLADLLRKAIQDRPGATPARVRVARESDAALVREVLPDTEVEVGPTPEIERIARLMSREIGPRASVKPGYLESGRFAAADMAVYFEHMAALWQAAPWRFFDDTQVLELDVPSLGVFKACVSVLGASRQSFGAVVFDSFEDFEQFYSLAGPPPGAGDKSWDLGVSSLGLTYSRGAELPANMRFEVAQNSWVVASADAYPLLMPVDPDAHLRPATERDLQLGCAVAAALVALVREHGRSLRSGIGDELTTSIELQASEPLAATIRFPHSHAPDDTRDEPLPPEAEIERARQQGVRRLEAFLESETAGTRTQEWREIAELMLMTFHDFKLDHLDGRLEGVRAWQVTVFLLEYLPRSVMARSDEVELTPDVLDAYFEWLGANGHEPELVMARVRARVERLREGFKAKALDPASFGPAKAFAMSAVAAGVDMNDPAALTAHQATFNRELDQARPTVLRRSRPRALKAGQVIANKKLEKPRRWFALEGEPMPAPAAACPCGSGRAFRRCCMPR